MSKIMTTKWPLSAILVELAWQLQKRGWLLRLEWRPRQLNQAADRLSNGDTTGFDPAKRVEVTAEMLRGEILPLLLAAGENWGAQLEALRQAKREREGAAAGGPSRKKPRRLDAGWNA